jgi:Glyoxalase-like domain
MRIVVRTLMRAAPLPRSPTLARMCRARVSGEAPAPAGSATAVTGVAVDHVFICCSVGGGEADSLKALGLTEGTPNVHPGQGTACRRFFFSNAYLELVWVSDPREAQSETGLPTRLWERWAGRSQGACPFAIILRPEGEGNPSGPPFPSWSYRPSYMPAGVAIEIGRGTPLTEPEFMYLGFQRGRPRSGREPIDHDLPVRALTGVTVGGPIGPLSEIAASFQAAGLVAFRSSADYVLELVFDGGAASQRADLRPVLPLVFHW